MSTNGKDASKIPSGVVVELESLDYIFILEYLADLARELDYPEVEEFWTALAAAEAGRRISWEKPMGRE